MLCAQLRGCLVIQITLLEGQTLFNCLVNNVYLPRFLITIMMIVGHKL